MELERLLERGRGAGQLGALELGADAIPLVIRCVLEDPRWDRQVEARDDYYGRLLQVLGADARAIVDALAHADPNECELARNVLIQLAWRGDAVALEAIVERVRVGAETATELGYIGTATFVEHVHALAGRRLEPEDTPSPRPSRSLDPELDTDGLIELATSGTDNLLRVFAARELGTRGYADLVPQAERFLRSECGLDPAQLGPPRIRRGWLAYLDALPPAATLDRARAWFHAKWPLSLAAEKILVRHAEPGDLAMLMAAGATALAEHRRYRLCSVLDALARLEAPESIELLCQVYRETDYSYARVRACEALLPHHEHSAAQELLVESLWDCEFETRVCGCEGVDPTLAAVRLRELESDPFEHENVRAAAREALAEL